MINKENLAVKAAGIVTALGAGAMALASHAAVDSDLSSGLSSTTAIFTDNKGIIITFLVGAFAVALVIRIVLKSINRGGGMVSGAISRGHRR